MPPTPLPRPHCARATRSGSSADRAFQAALSSGIGADWATVLEGQSEIGFGKPAAPPGLGAALAEGPDACETAAEASAGALKALSARFCTSVEQAQALQGWLQEVVDALRVLAPEARFRVRLERLRGAGCSRLHVDQLPLRLLCTLHGPGTEWWPAPVRDRARLLRPGEAQAPPAQLPQRLPTGLPALLRGERFPSRPGAGVVHRSPAPTGKARVLLAIDLLL